MPHRRRTLTRTVLIGATLALGSACGSAAPKATAAPPQATTVQLVPAPAGTATLNWIAATHLVTADLDTYGFALNSMHALRLVAGSCAAPGAALASFPDIQTDGYGAFKGNLTSTARVSGIAAASHVEVLLGDSKQADSTPGSTALACGAVNPSNTGAPVTLNDPALTAASGTVSLSYAKSTKSVTVHVVAKGLAPSSAHAVHIHFGSCRQESGVLYSVGDVTSNGSGDVDATKTISGVSFAPPVHGWYADIHDGSTASLETGGQPTLLFAPILCGDHT